MGLKSSHRIPITQIYWAFKNANDGKSMLSLNFTWLIKNQHRQQKRLSKSTIFWGHSKKVYANDISVKVKLTRKKIEEEFNAFSDIQVQLKIEEEGKIEFNLFDSRWNEKTITVRGLNTCKRFKVYTSTLNYYWFSFWKGKVKVKYILD